MSIGIRTFFLGCAGLALNVGCSGSDNGGAASGGAGGVVYQPAVALGPQQTAEKLDVLFVVDNSTSMADKVGVLEASVPAFVHRLVNPLCVDTQGMPVPAQPATGAAPCITGTRELTPATDLHLGVITTSIGAHGGTVCALGAATDHLDDQAELIPAKRPAVRSYMDSGYLSWDRAGATGVADADAITADLQAMIGAVGEDGCGFEAPLEAMYRFLVDPDPPVSVEHVDGMSTPTGTNEELLAQRAAFLRPDSAVAIVILSDENDCSILDSGVGWFVGSSSRMPRASVECAANPNDKCCRSCAQNPRTRSAGCSPLADDANCKTLPEGAPYATWDAQDDVTSLRCYNQMGRFGFDLLNPLARYTDGLTNPQVPDRNGALVDNPFLAGRSATLVSVATIVGVPWQDLATASGLDSPPLEYLDAAGLDENARWPLLVGDSADNTQPGDPFMIESIVPRSGVNPVTNVAISPPSSVSPTANPINGHEQNVWDNDDLQFACTFALLAPRVCAAGDLACACSGGESGNPSEVAAANSPLCQPPAGGAAGTTQYYAEGYPGTRELLFARSLGARGVPGSICPSNLANAESSDYAYQPTFNALLKRISATLK